VVDPTTVRFTLNEPVAPFLHYLALPESVIVSKKYTQDKGDLAATAMGAGPYTFKEWKKGQSITLEQFDKYYESGLPKTPSVRFSFLADDSARVNALTAGDVDIIESLPWNVTASIESDATLQGLTAPGPFMGLIYWPPIGWARSAPRRCASATDARRCSRQPAHSWTTPSG